MTWPTDTLTKVHMDQDSDSPLLMRGELVALLDVVKLMLAEVTAAATVYHSGNSGAGNGQNADLLDGQHGSFYQSASNINAGTLALARLATGFKSALDADLLDGQHGSYYRNAANLNAGTILTARLPTTAVNKGGTGSTTSSGARTNLGLGALATLSSVTASQIDAGAVGSSEIASNAVDSAEIVDGAATQAKIATDAIIAIKIASQQVGTSELGQSSVTQSKINTSSGIVSTTGTTNATLPGGQYGFYPQIRSSGTGGINDYEVRLFFGTPVVLGTSYKANIYLVETEGNTLSAQQRYINSSPPYNLGDGDVPIFVFAKVDANGKPISIYSADVPPWAYNGPTRVTVDHITKQGEKFQFQTRVIDRAAGRVETIMVPITHDIKNADMGLIPHPFEPAKPGESIILLDPPDTQKLKNLCDAGESINELLHDDYLRIDNAPLIRKTPTGVTAHKWKWRQTG